LDLIEISIKYENIPVPVFEREMDAILKDIEYLESNYRKISVKLIFLLILIKLLTLS